MGMAATQAFLLTMTKRRNDIRLDLNMLSAEKIALANESDKVALNYNDALNSKVLKWSNDAGATMYDLSYSTLMNPSQLNGYQPYMITDLADHVVVDDNYLKYAKLISPSGAPGGNYDGYRSQILSEILGVEPAAFATTSSQSSALSDIEAQIDQLKKNEPQLVYETADAALSKLGKVSKNAVTVKTGKVGDAEDVTANTSWGEIVKSISNGDNFVSYLTYDGSEEGAISKFKQILSEFSQLVKGATGSFDGIPDNAFSNAYNKTLSLFTDEFAYNEAMKHDHREYAGQNAPKYNTICHQHDKKSNMFDDSNHAYAVSLTNMASVFLTYLFEGDNANITTAAGQNLVNLQNQKMPTKESVDAHDKWQKELDALNEQLGNTNSSFTEPLDAEDKKKIDFYDAIFNAIAKKGWAHNNNINDPDYLNNIMQVGIYNITMAEKKGGTWTYDESCPTTCQNIFQVTDSNEINKITAEYEREKAKIAKKEDKIDVQMQKLETEDKAISEMLEAQRNMINENVERTFDTFS